MVVRVRVGTRAASSPVVPARRPISCALAFAALLAVGCDRGRALDELAGCEVWLCGEPRPADPCADVCEGPACAEVTVFARDPESGACVALPSACAVPDGWERFSDREACEGGLTMCASDGDCRRDEVCDVTSCAADAVGTCALAPETCPEAAAEVLGCDGVLYLNDCERLVAGVAVAESSATGGGCPEGGPGVWARDPETAACSFFGTECDVPDGWAYYLDRAACEGAGCSPEPVWIWDPEGEGCVRVESDCDVPHGWEFYGSAADCERDGLRCGPDRGCAEGLVCELPSCDAVVGSCVPVPADCVAAPLSEPPSTVCGCDGLSYPDDCSRVMAGVALAHDGPC